MSGRRYELVTCNAALLPRSKNRLKLERQLRKWQDAPVPPGFDTAFGFFSRHWPEEYSQIGRRTQSVVEADYEPLRNRSRRWGFEVISVRPPTGVKRRLYVLGFAVEVLGSFYLNEALGAPRHDESGS